MSEICKNCPILDTVPDAPLLCAAAARMADVEKCTDNPITYTVGEYTPEQTLEAEGYSKTPEEALDSLGFSPRSISLARKCAQQISWSFCEFQQASDR